MNRTLVPALLLVLLLGASAPGKAVFRADFRSISFGNVAQPGLDEDFLQGDLTVVGSLAGGGPLGDVETNQTAWKQR